MSISTKIPMLIRRRTKIVATLGPASDSEAAIADLMNAGVCIFRLNFSHGEHAQHETTLSRIRKVAKRLNRIIAVFADLCGPKIRVGRFEGGGVELQQGSLVTITADDVLGTPECVPSQYTGLAADVTPGARILFDDGLLHLEVESVSGDDVLCRVIEGGLLKDHKGMNLPDVPVSAPSLTDKDRADARFALQLGVEFLALSFVRSRDDVESLREWIVECGGDARIIAKIEKPQALDNIEGILNSTDVVMVARGDLGVELPAEQVPAAQDQLVSLARKHRRPVIVATQMLESMIENPRPTRAEVSDVAHAVGTGVDAVMLSGETAVGRHAVKAVQTMDRIARQAEAQQWEHGAFEELRHSAQVYAQEREPMQQPMSLVDAVARSTAQLSRDLRVRAIVVPSNTGASAMVMSSARPGAPILVISSEIKTCRLLQLAWGTVPVCLPDSQALDREQAARDVVVRKGLAEGGDHCLLVRGFRWEDAKNEPSVMVLRL